MVQEVSRDVWPVEIGERLRYRSQFVLGPRFVEDLPAWSRVELGHGLRLSAHPDLPVTRVVDGPRAITLLGYMLDPFQPAATDADLVRDLLATLAAAGDLVEQTGRYGGRWILIVDDGSSRRLFHDAIGMRQVYYTDVARTGEVWCASQPGIVAGLLQLPVSEEALALLAAYPRPYGEH
ncbi:MAG TPA: hypothetical protein VI007_13970, partial [bacterium]